MSLERMDGATAGAVAGPLLPAVAVGCSLAAAAGEMLAAGIDGLLVVDASRVEGILTSRDLLRALSVGRRPEAAVDTLLSAPVVSVAATASLQEAWLSMAFHRIRHLLVLDEGGLPRGLLTETDLLRYIAEPEPAVLSSVVAARPLCLPREMPALEVARRMFAEDARCAVVVEDGRPVGTFSERDALRLFRPLPLAEVGALMQAPAATIALGASASASDFAGTPPRVVLDATGRVVGLLGEHEWLACRLQGDFSQMLQSLVEQRARALDEQRYQSVLNRLPVRVVVKDASSTYVSCNEAFAQDVGLSREQVVGRNDFDFFPADLAERYRAEDRQVMAAQTTLSQEERYFLHGEERWRKSTKVPEYDEAGHVCGVGVLFDDITEKKRDLDEMRRMSWALLALSRSNSALVHGGSEQELLQGVCEAITAEERYPLAWLGWAQDDECRSVAMAAVHGRSAAYVEGLEVSWGEGPTANGPTGRAIRLGQTQVANDLAAAAIFGPWQKRAAQHELRASVAVPVRLEGRVAGALMVYSSAVNAFGPREVELFEELADNLAFGIESRRTRQAYDAEVLARKQQAERLRQALEDAIAAIAAVLEQRDPYTAGHQQHVAELAVMIGRELGLDDDRLHGLYLGGIVHDLGKIQVPAEILTKPARLNAAEFALVKLHPEVGYQLLKKIDFPWPVADITRQHHEYLDGSGYPLGLRGEQILLEARILTVADIVESMSSDRPYRPALGLDEAMREISHLRGEKLDPAVVDACIEVLRRGEFSPNLLQLVD